LRWLWLDGVDDQRAWGSLGVHFSTLEKAFFRVLDHCIGWGWYKALSFGRTDGCRADQSARSRLSYMTASPNGAERGDSG
jgi:hypothetical protein